MKTLKQIIEAAGREITVNWDMGKTKYKNQNY